MASVQKKLAAKITHTTATRTSIGQISSAYSLLCVRPSGSVTAASTMISCQPKKLRRESRSDAILVFSRRWVE